MVRKTIVKVISLLFIMLWCYTAAGKLMEYDTALLNMSRSPFIMEYARILAWAVPVMEIVISMLLITDRTRTIALYCSLFLITLFSAYIYAMLHLSYYVPCACGGILNSLSWEDHFLLNLVFVCLAIIAILLSGSYAGSEGYNKNSADHVSGNRPGTDPGNTYHPVGEQTKRI